jgi:hypothetical protein
MGQVARGLAVSIALLAIAVPAAQARDPGTPLPPTALLAESTPDGVRLTWQPPAYDGTSPVASYTVYRLDDDGMGWVALVTVPASSKAYLDPAPVAALSAYQVVALNDAGPSLPSQPAAAAFCPFAGASVDFQAPFVHPGINWDCIGTLPGQALWLH